MISQTIVRKVAGLKVLGKSPAGYYLRLNRRVWETIPPNLRDTYAARAYGSFLHSSARLLTQRQQFFGTFFLRNRPALNLLRRLADKKAQGSTLRIAVLGCSAGAEVYSVVWTVRSIRPDLKVVVHALDISKEILNFAERGVYDSDTSGLVGASIFERLSPDEKAQMFDWTGDRASVKSWLREGVTWQVGDASSPELVRALGPQDIVVANNFLCHMESEAAESCLRNIAGLVDRGGYLFVAGVDLDVRAKVARELGWRPIEEQLEQIHDGDSIVRGDWPCYWWGLEPLDRRRKDWQLRYAAVFAL